jgi:starvation-inducible DNA-binding protein
MTMPDVERSSLVAELNRRASELNALGLAAHNAHVNVTGPQFLALHRFLERLYEGLLTEHADAVMERVRALGGVAETVVTDLPTPSFEGLTGIAVAAAIRTMLQTVVRRLSSTRASVAGERDPDTYRVLDDVLHELNKPLWMLAEIVEPGAPAAGPTAKSSSSRSARTRGLFLRAGVDADAGNEVLPAEQIDDVADGRVKKCQEPSAAPPEQTAERSRLGVNGLWKAEPEPTPARNAALERLEIVKVVDWPRDLGRARSTVEKKLRALGLR